MENTTIQKPIMIEMNEFKESIARLINESAMPMAIVNMILREVLVQCTEIESQQYKTAAQQYSTALGNVNKDDKENEDKVTE